MAWLLEREVRRELPEEWRGIVPTEVFLRESGEIVEKAKEEGIVLRVLGGLGIAMHCQGYRDFAQKLGRIGTGVVEGQEYSDIDFVSYSNYREKMKVFLIK